MMVLVNGKPVTKLALKISLVQQDGYCGVIQAEFEDGKKLQARVKSETLLYTLHGLQHCYVTDLGKIAVEYFMEKGNKKE